MTRFDATGSDQRQSLIVEAITAHQTRDSQFITLEGTSDDDSTWVQYRAAEGLMNLDCTASERDRLAELLAEYPEFTITDQTSPDTADGINIRIQGYSDERRTAELIDRIFQSVFSLPDEYRLWVTEV